MPRLSEPWRSTTLSFFHTNKARSQTSTTRPSDSSWSSVGVAYQSSGFVAHGGNIGISSQDLRTAIESMELFVDADDNGSYETLHFAEDFTLDDEGLADDALEHDAAGNLTYDGRFVYAYDAWNRQVAVYTGFRRTGDDGTGGVSLGTLQQGAVVSTSRYDGLSRRIEKAVTNSGSLDATYRYYHHGQSVVEVRNGSDAVLKQFVWANLAGGYIDELVQTSLNDDPADSTEQDCETVLYALQDANYNVLGLVDASGNLVERYEYTPYGERTVFVSAGINDPMALTPARMSQRVTLAGVEQPYGLLEVGHQGLMHDEETGLIQNRRRMLHPRLGRFMQRDPLGYVDGMSVYA